MGTTTYEAIRANLIAQVAARTPTKLSDVRFRPYDGEAREMADWAEQVGEGAFRTFDVRHGLDSELVPPHDLVGYRVRQTLILEVAYPDVSLRYAEAADANGEALIEADQFDLDKAIGAPADRIDGHAATLYRGQSAAEYPGGRIVRHTFELTYNRSVPT